jgi:hypothetical protein
VGELARDVADAIGRLADEGVIVFVPEGAEGDVSVDEDGNLVIRSETRPQVSEVDVADEMLGSLN